MTNVEFKKLLKNVFNTHSVMKDRNYHTVNELLYVLRYDGGLNCLQGVNISVVKADGSCMCIPCLDAFVNVKTLGIWFEDDSVEFDSDAFENDGKLMRFDNITVYESEDK